MRAKLGGFWAPHSHFKQVALYTMLQGKICLRQVFLSVLLQNSKREAG